MSLQDAIRDALPGLRAAAEARMTSRCIVSRNTGKTAQNPDTGRVEPVWTVVATDVPFRLKDSGGSRRIEVGGVHFEEADGIGSLPATFADLADDDHLDVTGGEWAGSAYRVVKAIKSDQATARRVPVVEVPRPTEWG